MSKWVKKLSIEEADAILKERLERKRMLNRVWAQNNKEKKAANKKAYLQRKKKNILLVTAGGAKTLSSYRPNWKEAPVYNCPELTYRGKTT
jgi:hypothetical protein